MASNACAAANTGIQVCTRRWECVRNAEQQWRAVPVDARVVGQLVD
jgi:hypothetical protein